MQQYNVTGMSCAACSARVEKAVSKVDGVTSCAVSLLTNSMGVEGTASSDAIIRAVEAAGYGASLRGSSRTAGTAAGTRTAGTAGGARASSAATEEGKSAKAIEAGTLTSEDFGEATAGAANDYIREMEDALIDRETPALRRRLIWSVGFLLVLMYCSMGHMMWGWPVPAFLKGNPIGLAILQMLLALIVMFINRKFFTSGFTSLFHGAPNMDTLVALGSGVSFGYSLVMLFAMTAAQARGETEMVMHHMHDLYFESAAMIVTLITVGKMLEAMSKGRTTSALKSLMKLAPETATVVRDGNEIEVPVADVRRGETFLVRPGGRIPVDGIIKEGTSAVNESALTGESIPVDKAAGDAVSAATINTSGFLRCEATRVGEDTTLAQIIRMVSDAAATKAPIARIADKISGIFVPAVIAIAAVVFVIWMLVGAALPFALARAISVLVISCPCALGLATPVAIMVGNGVGAKNGILFKTSAALESAGRAETVVLDKTGTITRGEPEVTDVLPARGVTEEELIRCAALLEARSEHPLARAVIQYAGGNHASAALQDTGGDHASAALQDAGGDHASDARQEAVGEASDALQEAEQAKLTDFEAIPGNGLRATYEGHVLVGGSGDYMKMQLAGDSGNYQETQSAGQSGLPDEMQQAAERFARDGKTPLFFAKDGALLGVIAVADVIKDESAQAVRELAGMGIRSVMLTGDNAQTARAIAGQAGVDDVIAGVLPDGKEAAIRSLGGGSGSHVAMVGDGINDAPALVRADTGIAIGAGTDVAIDAADVVLTKSRLTDVPAAIRLARATLRNIHQNLFWAFFYNVICIPLAAGVYYHRFGITLSPMIGAAAMSLSSFCVVMNALRLNLVNIHDASRDKRRKAKIQETEQHEQQKDRSENTDMKKTMEIKGMMCAHCEANVKKALEAIEGVTGAEVSHEAGTAIVSSNEEISDDVLREAVEAKDYEVTAIKVG